MMMSGLYVKNRRRSFLNTHVYYSPCQVRMNEHVCTLHTFMMNI